MTISCIGTGAMGSAIFKSICNSFDKSKIKVTNRSQEKAKIFAKENGCVFVSSNKEAVQNTDYVFIAVKPQFLKNVFDEIKNDLIPNQVVVSMAAGVTIEKLKQFAPNARFIRIMPNVCAQISQGMTAICCNDDIKQNELDDVKSILSTTGLVEQVSENLMDCATAVSGSGPAFVFMFIESMADAAVKCGMSRTQAYTYVAQTVCGSASLVLQTKKHPGILKDSVCSPCGTTIEGVCSLEKDGFRSSIIRAVSASFEKSKNMAK